MRTDRIGEESWVKDVDAFLSRGPGILVRLRGLPYECTALQVIEFFKRGEHPAEVVDAEDGVYFVKKPDGKATGDAFVLFPNEAEANAGLTKHRESIGSRYIELFRTQFTEMEQVVRRTLEAKSRPHVPRPPQVAVSLHSIPEQTIPGGMAKDCIRLRGLPFEAQVQHVLELLGPHAKNIALHGVHMVYNSVGQPTGEVFVQMDCEPSATRAAVYCHNSVLGLGKKRQFVDVCQCSGEDIQAFLVDTTQVPSAGLGEMLRPLIPLYPTGMMDQGPPGPPTPASLPGSLPGSPHPGPHPPISGPILYVIVSNPPPEPNFFTPSPLPEWIPEYPINQQLSILPPDYFVS